jgi:hypothetical protein
MAIRLAPQTEKFPPAPSPWPGWGDGRQSGPALLLTVGTLAQGFSPMPLNPDTLPLRPPQPQNHTPPPIFPP